jgi:hypothetical protein
MIGGRGQFGLSGGWRRIVALLAVAAWVFAIAMCPEVPESFGAATLPNIQADLSDANSGRSDRHASCHPAAHSSAVVQFSKAIRGGGAIATSAAPGVALAQPFLSASASPVVKIARAIDDRPRPRSAHFASFWPHAPPLTL